MSEILISDTSALIILHKLGRLTLLKSLFQHVFITSKVMDEFGDKIPEWIKLENPKETTNNLILNSILDPGEASAISLALEKSSSVVLIDEKKGRMVAKKLGLKVIGSVGILLIAKRKGEVALLKPLLDEMIKNKFHISKSLYSKALVLAGEL